ncbi:MAG: methionyl-tRNA formyltransferase [Elusimicrobiales bacterium]|nr:methionyl-tRNA formyltransferase [Elusimicrobiales bacterium]
MTDTNSSGKKMRAVFLGTPDVAVPFLDTVVNSPYCETIAALSQPDRPSGRGMKLQPSPVSRKAAEYGIPVYKPAKKKEIHAIIQELKPDIAITCAYGRIILEETLAIAKQGFLNVHFSLLPKYRGAAPVQRALMAGEKESGVTIFWLDKGMDTGDILMSKPLPVEISDDAETLFAKMTALGTQMLADTLAICAAGNAPHIPQQGEPSYAAMISPEEALFDFNAAAHEIHDRIRGLACGPRARFMMNIPGKAAQSVQVFSTLPCDDDFGQKQPGTIAKVEKGGGFYVKCKIGSLYIKEVKPEGKKTMKGSDFLNGARLKAGSLIG